MVSWGRRIVSSGGQTCLGRLVGATSSGPAKDVEARQRAKVGGGSHCQHGGVAVIEMPQTPVGATPMSITRMCAEAGKSGLGR
jgi:hypothetical protein